MPVAGLKEPEMLPTGVKLNTSSPLTNPEVILTVALAILALSTSVTVILEVMAVAA